MSVDGVVVAVDVGAAATVALHVVVATLEDASVTWSVIVCVPATAATVSGDVVAPVPQSNATGATPSAEAPVQVMLADAGTPVQEAVSADAEPANAKSAAATENTNECLKVINN